MELKDKLEALAEKAEKLVDQIKTEEATKQSLILPFFQLLGYDVFNPLEFCPEFDADFGVKKGEKVDYAILLEDTPIILIEAKACNDNLEKHGSQLFRYFSTTSAKFGVLTNGIVYKFYTDLDEANKMDEKPFFELNLFDLKDPAIEYLKNFHKDVLDINNIVSTASDLKYTSLVKEYLKSQLLSPSEDFANYLLSKVYDGRRTSTVVEKFIPIVKKSFNQFINDTMSEKFKETLKSTNPSNSDDAPVDNANGEIAADENVNKIVTTAEELEAFAIIKSILRHDVDLKNITYKDTESYFGILYNNNTRKWICRLSLGSRKSLILPNDDKSRSKINLESLDDLYTYDKELIENAKRFES